MTKTLDKCPKCGHDVVKLTSKISKAAYYKCTNEDCHFAVPEEYTNEQIDLQRLTLQTVCKGCGKPLEIAVGPKGFYPICYNCNYDTKPQRIGNITVNKYANAYSAKARQEIKAIRKAYEEQASKMDVEFGFENITEVKSTPATSNKKESIPSSRDTVLCYMRRHLDKPMTIKKIYTALGLSKCCVNDITKKLRADGITKIVGYEETKTGPLTMCFQLKESPLSELETTSDAKSYISLSGFIQYRRKENQKCVAVSVLQSMVDKLGLKNVFLTVPSGMVKAYKLSDLNKIIKSYYGGQDFKQLSFKDTENIVVEVKKEKNASNGEAIMNFLNANLDTPFSANSISKHTSIPLGIVRTYMNAWKRKGKIKIVGWEENRGDKTSGPKASQIQLMKSPLEKLTLEKDGNMYYTIQLFWTKKLKRRLSQNEVIDRIEEAALQTVPVDSNGRIYRGYDYDELCELFPEINQVKRLHIGTHKRNKKELVKVGASEINQQVHLPSNTPNKLGSPEQSPKRSLLSTITSMFCRR